MERKPLVIKQKFFWWLAKPRYVKYILRELCSVFIGGYALLLAYGLYTLSQGPQQYKSFLFLIQQPGMRTLHVLTFVFLLYNTFTWFNVSPQAMSLWVFHQKLPSKFVVVFHYLIWMVVSLGIYFCVLEGDKWLNLINR